MAASAARPLLFFGRNHAKTERLAGLISIAPIYIPVMRKVKDLDAGDGLESRTGSASETVVALFPR